ncbi:MAG: nitrilase-related carbon-nitrogen hydrolase [Phycisphaerales bacterium JB037]
MRAHLVQFDIAWEDRAENFRRVEALLAPVDLRPGDLVLLPEMFDSGFSLNADATADHDARTLGWLTDFARARRVTVQGGRTVKPDPAGKARNQAPAIGPDGSLLATYEKIHPFSFGREPEAFEGGDSVVTYAWIVPEDSGPAHRATVGPAICYDLRFPELFRLAAMRGAEVLALGANWPDARQSHWRALAIARAIENQAFVLAVNRTGPDPHLNYVGGSIAVDPMGTVLGELADEQAVLSVELDLPGLRAWRDRFPALRDIRLLDPRNPAPRTGGTGADSRA